MSNKLQPDRLRTLMIPLLVMAIALLPLAACRGSDADSTGDSADAPAAQEQQEGGGVPTMPAAQFAAVEAEVDLTKVAETAEEATTEPDDEADLTLGASAYERLCVECHGTAGEGVADKGEAITGVDIDIPALVDLLRTGGGYGNEHIFGPAKISDDGIASLFAFMQTLSAE